MLQQPTLDRMASVLLLSSLIAGFVAGVCARIVMRIVALTAHMPLSFTGGTTNIIFIGTALGFLAGFVYTILVIALSSYTKTKKYIPGPMWRGLLLGVLLLVIFGLPNLLGPSSPGDDINLGIPVLNRYMFAALPLIFGITLGGSEIFLYRYLPPRPVTSSGDTSSSKQQE